MSFFTKIEQAVNRGLNFRYSKHLPFVFFAEEIKLTQTLTSLPFSLSGPEFDTIVLKRRLPQTRIYVSEFYNTDVHLRLISFFDFHWLLFYPLSAACPAIDILPAEDYELKAEMTEGKWVTNAMHVPLSAVCCVQIGRMGTEAPDLSVCIQQEHERHPLRFLKISDSKTVQTIDRLWAQLPWIDEQGKPYTERFRHDPELAIWLKMLYAHFGWDGFEFNQPSLERPASGFLKKYLANDYELSEIQNFWEKVHFPANVFKLKQEIRQNPSEFIAFALLIIKEHFVWQETFIALLLSALPPLLHGLIELLLLLKQETPLFVNGQNVEYNANGSKAVLQHHIQHDNGGVTAGNGRHHKRGWTSLEVRPFFTFKIDQQASLAWQGESKHLQITPFLWRPPMAEPVFHYTKLEFKGVQFQIPLAWQQFEVHIDTLRIKFLRKKKRFQLSVRLGKTDALGVNDQTYNAQDMRYHTVYQTIPPQTKDVRPNSLIWLNRFGGSRYLADGMYLRGWIQDQYQVLHESVQVVKEGERHSVQVLTNEASLHTQKNWREPFAYRVGGRYCNSSQTELTAASGIINKFLYTPAEQLISRLMIFSDENPVIIHSAFKRNMGLVPECLPLNRFAPYPERVTIIIAYKFAGETVDDKQPVAILRNISGAKRDVLLIYPNGLNDLFNTFLKNK